MICLGGIQGQVGWDLGQPGIATGNSAHGRGFKRRKEDSGKEGPAEVAIPTLPSGVEHLHLGW